MFPLTDNIWVVIAIICFILTLTSRNIPASLLGVGIAAWFINDLSKELQRIETRIDTECSYDRNK